MPNLQPPRRGWPLPYIPAGEASWRAFVAHATHEQLEQACLSMVYDLLLEGNLALATEGLREVLLDRARRGVGGVPQ